MGRIRTIKPDFMDSGSTRALSRDARLFFLQMVVEVDDDGRCRFTPKRLAGLLYPGDEDVHSTDIEAWAAECEGQGMAVVYAVDGERYFQMTNFRKHQVINKYKASKLPPPREDKGGDQGEGRGREEDGTRTGPRQEEYRQEVEVEVEQGSGRGNELAPKIWPALTRKNANDVLDQGHEPGSPHLTAIERKKLRPQVEEWLDAGHEPEVIAAAIASSPWKTPAAVGGEMRKSKTRPNSVGDDALIAGATWLASKQKEQHA